MTVEYPPPVITRWLTASNVWLLVLLLLIAVDAIIAPGHIPIVTFLVAIALLTTVTLRVIAGVRGGIARGKEEANS